MQCSAGTEVKRNFYKKITRYMVLLNECMDLQRGQSHDSDLFALSMHKWLQYSLVQLSCRQAFGAIIARVINWIETLCEQMMLYVYMHTILKRLQQLKP